MAWRRRSVPDHCVQNSEGAALHPLLKQQDIAAVFHKGENPVPLTATAPFSTTTTGKKRSSMHGCASAASAS